MTSLDPKISVIIPIYNAEQTIEKCLLSVLNQTYVNLEVVLIDDKSTDSTPSILRRISESDSRIKVFVNKVNSGQGYSRNFGINIASGQIVTFIDADDYFVDQNYIEICIEQLLKSSADVVITPAIREYPNNQKKYDHFNCSDGIYRSETVANLYLSRKLQTHAAWGKFYRYELIRNVKFVECGYSQDVIFVLNALLRCNSACIFSHYGYVYSQEGTSTWRSKDVKLIHVLSGLRLLSEIIEKKKNYNFLALKGFLSIWNKDHGRRFIRYIKQRNANWDDLSILNQFMHNLGELFIPVLASVDNKEIRNFLSEVYQSTFNCKGSEDCILDNFLSYAKNLSSQFSLCHSNKQIPKKLIISITSYPARIKACSAVISGILSGDLPSEHELVLYLSKDEFKAIEELPKEIRQMSENGLLKIKFVPGNIRSYKKLVPALTDYPDLPILTIDDDVKYPPNFINTLYQAYLLEPTQIHCNRCRRVRIKESRFMPYKSWPLEMRKEPLTPSLDLLFTGVGGVLYPPGSLYSSATDRSLFSEICPNGDDLWFWLMAVMKGTKVHRVDNFIEDYDLIDGTQESSLWKTNGKNENDLALDRLIKFYPFIPDLLDKTVGVKVKSPTLLRRIINKIKRDFPFLYNVLYKIYDFLKFLRSHKCR